ncbi:hypothetical protein MPSEU_000963600 [Mayamaea pseudoterrestris]|nr:hypothetical protein MPSEU_000963600 [Mayamaea pseudoterrestris]
MSIQLDESNVLLPEQPRLMESLKSHSEHAVIDEMIESAPSPKAIEEFTPCSIESSECFPSLDKKEALRSMTNEIIAIEKEELHNDDAAAYFHELAEQRSSRRRGIMIVRCNREWQSPAAYAQSMEEYRERRDRRYKCKALSTEPASVKFNLVTIHEFPMVLGDNPGCFTGPPLSIDWNEQQTMELPVEEYESTRPPRRLYAEMVMPSSMRQQILRRAGYGRNEIVDLTKPVNITRRNRQRSKEVQNLDRLHELAERLLRATKHVATLGYRKRQERKFLEPYVLYQSSKIDGDLSISVSSTVALEISEEM